MTDAEKWKICKAKNCPFCGAPPYKIEGYSDEGFLLTEEDFEECRGGYPSYATWLDYVAESWSVSCSGCTAFVYGRTPKEAFDRWNRRVAKGAGDDAE